MVLGDRRPFVTALITLDPDGLTHWRRMNGKQGPAAELVGDPELLASSNGGRRGQQARLPPRVDPQLRRPAGGLHGGERPSDAVDEAEAGGDRGDFAAEIEELYRRRRRTSPDPAVPAIAVAAAAGGTGKGRSPAGCAGLLGYCNTGRDRADQSG